MPYYHQDQSRVAVPLPVPAAGPSDSIGAPQMEPAYSSDSVALSAPDHRQRSDDLLHHNDEDLTEDTDRHERDSLVALDVAERSIEVDKVTVRRVAPSARIGRRSSNKDTVHIMVGPNMREPLIAAVVLAQKAVRGQGFIV